MKMYDDIITQLIYSDNREKFTKSLIMYKLRFYALFEHHTFKFMIRFHKNFVYKRIVEERNNVQA